MWAAVFLLYVLSVWIHSLLLPGPRVLATYYDEWLYWGTAKNFWTEARFTLNYAPIEFYKFVYSLVLSPLFRIGDGESGGVRGIALDNPPLGAGIGSMSREEILSIRDGVERRRAIADNPDVFGL